MVKVAVKQLAVKVASKHPGLLGALLLGIRNSHKILVPEKQIVKVSWPHEATNIKF